MAEASFITFRDRQVLLMDFSHLRDAARLSRLTDDAIRLAGSAATPQAVLALLDLTGTRMDRVTLASLRKLSQHNGPFIKLMAFAGLGAISGSALKSVLRATGRANHKVFKGRREGLEWLTSPQAPS